MTSFWAFGQSYEDEFTYVNRHEIEFGYGAAPLMSLLTHPDYGTVTPLNFNLQYMYNVSKHFSVGTILSYSVLNKEESVEGVVMKNKKNHLFSLGLVGRAYWFYKEHFAMYSKYGITLSADTKHNFSDLFFCPINLSLVGLEYGGEQFRVYVEPLSLCSTWPAAQVGVKYIF